MSVTRSAAQAEPARHATTSAPHGRCHEYRFAVATQPTVLAPAGEGGDVSQADQAGHNESFGQSNHNNQSTKLSAKQRGTQALIGSVKFAERCHPRASLLLHRLSCVMACPPPEAAIVARAVLASMYAERDVGITYGGSGLPIRGDEYELKGMLSSDVVDLDGQAPRELEAHADATWSDRNVYGLLLTFGGGVVYHVTKKIPLIVDSSMETEAIASAKAGEQIAVAREILRAFGVPPLRPTLIGTDNLANYKVATGVGCPSRSRHFLRRYFVLKRRIASGEVTMVHVPDVQMPADCLTKWLPSDKLRRSVEYMTNRRAAPEATAAYSEITLDDIADAIANVSDHSHDGNLHDRAYQVGGSVVSDPVSTVRSTVTSTAEGVSGGREKRRERFLSSS